MLGRVLRLSAAAMPPRSQTKPGLQDSTDGVCLAAAGGTQGAQKPGAAGASTRCVFQTAETKSEWLLAFPQAEMVFDSP